MPPLAILVDLDGVVRRWNIDDPSIEASNGLPSGALRQVAFAPEFLIPAITGVISDEVWRHQIAAELQRKYPEASAEEAVVQWSSSAGELEPQVLCALSQCRSELRLVLATNATSRLSSDLLRLGLSERFHAIANSSEIGAAKPSKSFFEAALRCADTRASEALFIDDTLSNVQAAAALGMRVHHFSDHEAMSSFLHQAGAINGNAL